MLLILPFSELGSSSKLQNMEVLNKIARAKNSLFALYDSAEISVGEIITIDSYSGKIDFNKIFQGLSGIIKILYFVDPNVILISDGAIFQKFEGLALRRNNKELLDTYIITGFDQGSINYTEILADIFYFTAGL